MPAADRFTPKLSFSPRDRDQLLASLLVGFLLVLPLALKVPMFVDDFGRSLNGSYDWSKDGRPLAELIYRFLMLGSDRVMLTSPLGQLLCLPGMAMSSWFLCRVFGHRSIWAGGLATVFLFGQPYFLQSLSYSFDSPLMVVAVLLALAGAACLLLLEGSRSRIATVTLLVCSLATYQPANSAFWIVVLMALIFPRGEGNRPAWRVLGDGLACQLLALLIYKFAVFNPLELKDYAAHHATLPAMVELPSVVLANTGTYLHTLLDDWWGTQAGELLIVAALVALIRACIGGPSSGASVTRRRWVISGCRSLMVLGVVSVSYGLPLLLAHPVFEPRMFVGIGVVMTSLALIATRAGGRDWWSRGVVVVLIAAAWACITITYAYASAQEAQQTFNREVLQSVTQTVRENGFRTAEFDRVVITGRSPRAPVASNTFRTIPYLKRLVKPVKAGWWGHIGLKHQGFRNPFKPFQPDQLRQLQPIASTSLYDVSRDGSTLVINFNDTD